MKENENNKVIISLQLPKEIHDKLKYLANMECTSVSYLIRRMLIKLVREENK